MCSESMVNNGQKADIWFHTLAPTAIKCQLTNHTTLPYTVNSQYKCTCTKWKLQGPIAFKTKA